MEAIIAYGIIGIAYGIIGGVIAVLAGLGFSIWAMVAGYVASAPVELYWPIPIGVYLLATCFTADEPLDLADEESKRRRRCSELMPRKKTEYKYNFLTELHSLVRAAKGGSVPNISLAQITQNLRHECTPELLPDALQTWLDRNFIEVERDEAHRRQYVRLLESGEYVCLRAQIVGMAAALRESDGGLQLSDHDKANYRNQLLKDIAVFSRGTKEAIDVAKLVTVSTHPCWPSLIDSSLTDLSRLRLIFFTAETSRQVGGFFHNSEPVTPTTLVHLTSSGKGVCERLDKAISLEAALEAFSKDLEKEKKRAYERQQEEDKRHKRCLEATSLEKIDFEAKFLLALHETRDGSTERVTLADVWGHLDHECAHELSGHALQVWHQRGDINVTSPRILERGEIYEDTDFSLTAAGRDLCIRAIILGSMEEALIERSKGYLMEKNEYNIHDTQIDVFAPRGKVHDNDFRRFVNSTDQFPLDQLAQELARLRNELTERASLENSPEQYIAIGEVSGAEIAARKGDRQGVWQHLARVGKWTLDIADQIGVSLAVEAIKAVFKAHNIPI